MSHGRVELIARVTMCPGPDSVWWLLWGIITPELVITRHPQAMDQWHWIITSWWPWSCCDSFAFCYISIFSVVCDGLPKCTGVQIYAFEMSSLLRACENLCVGVCVSLLINKQSLFSFCYTTKLILLPWWCTLKKITGSTFLHLP